MNHVYRLVFNRALGLLQVTAETGSLQKKSAGGSAAVGVVAPVPEAGGSGLSLRHLVVAIAVAIGSVAMPVVADTTLTSGGPQTLDAVGSDYDLPGGETISGTTGTTGGNASGTASQAGAGGVGSAALDGAEYTLVNDGQIVGGTGGNGGVASGTWSRSGDGGTGGSGVSGTDFQLTNTGTVSGGLGGGAGGSGWGYGGAGGTGGAAVSGSGFTLINTGTLSGGNGQNGGNASANGGNGGNGGAGVIATGGATIYNAGTISGGTPGGGGPGGSWGGSAGTAGNAIELSGGGNTLVLQDGSIVTGNIISSSGSTNGGDALILEGTQSNAFDVTGIRGFESYTKRGTGTWSLTGAPAPIITMTTVWVPMDEFTCMMFGPPCPDIETQVPVSSPNVTSWDIQAGTLSIGSDASLGDVSGGLQLSGGTLHTSADVISARDIALTGSSTIDNGGNDSIFSGVISGSGGLSFTGNGTTTLSGTSTYTGATSIDAGTLRAGAANVIASYNAVTVASGATFALNNYDQSIGSLAGAGSVALGSATLTTGGNNTSTSFSGAISGSGGLTKTGSGTLTLSGTNAHTGTTQVAGGTLALADGADLTASDEIVIDYLATLLTDNANTSAIDNSGTVAISAGSVLSVNGDFTNTGTFRTSLASASSYGQLDVSGTANLGGDLFVDVIGAPTLAHNSTLSSVISAGSVNGTFTTIADNSALFNFVAVYSGTGMDLSVRAAGATGVEDAVTSVGNHPAKGAARLFDQLIGGGSGGGTTVPGSLQMSDVITVLGQQSSQQAVSAVVSQTLPVLVGGGLFAAENLLANINRVVGARVDGLRGLASGNDFFTDRHLWLKPFGSWTNQDDRDGVSGFDADTSGFVLGADAAVGGGSTVGLAFAYARSDIDGNDSLTAQRLDVDVYQLVGYGSVDLGNSRVLSYQVDVGRNSNSGERRLSAFDVVAKADYDSTSVHAGASLGQTFQVSDALQVTPALRADYTHIRDDSYRETGAGALSLDVDSRSFEQLIVGVDGKLAWQIGPQLKLAANVGIGYDTIADGAEVTAIYAGAPGASFATQGLDRERWVGQAGLGLNYQVSDAVDLSVSYDAEARSGFDNQTVSAKLRWLF